MHPTIWVAANTLTWPKGGGHTWVYLNWALGLASLGCNVVWLEAVHPRTPRNELRSLFGALRDSLQPYGLADSIALCSTTDEPLRAGISLRCVGLEAAGEADLLLNLSYDAPAPVLGHFRRTAMLDIDPGLTQVWAAEDVLHVPEHDEYFTIGETVPSGHDDRRWHHVPPCVALDWWPVRSAPDDAPFTTVSSWHTRRDWVTDGQVSYRNSKRQGFLPYLDLPSKTDQRLELALCLEADDQLRLAPHEEKERRMLESHGWEVSHSYAVAGSPVAYQDYLQRSKAEFSCAKPSGIRMQNAWISDRTICYLASGKPAVVQHTGASKMLPDASGLFRFQSFDDAVRALEEVASDYDNQCRAARELAEEHFDGRVAGRRVLDVALAPA